MTGGSCLSAWAADATDSAARNSCSIRGEYMMAVCEDGEHRGVARIRGLEDALGDLKVTEDRMDPENG